MKGAGAYRLGLLGVLFLLAGGMVRAEQKVDEEHLAAQRELVAVLQEHFDALDPVEGLEARRVELEAELAALQANGEEGKLESDRLAQLERDIRTYSGGLDDYRSEFLRWVRLTARGERQPELRTRKGKIYRDIVIRRVTNVGLEIFHSTGTARLRHGDLSEEFQERFQWDEEEARSSLAAEEESDREVKRLQLGALERGLDPVVARMLKKSKLVLGELEPSARIVPAKLEPSGPLKPAELEPAGDLATRKLNSKKGE